MSTEAILHLNAVSLALCVAYLGLDKADVEANDTIKQGLEKAEETAIAVLTKMDVVDSHNPDGFQQMLPFRLKLKFYVLCHVANYPPPSGWLRYVHRLHREIYVPFLGFYRNRIDRKMVFILLMLCFVGLFYCKSVCIWDVKWFPSDSEGLHLVEALYVEKIMFFMYIAISVMVALSAIFGQRLKKVPLTCAKIKRAIDTHMSKQFEYCVKWSNGVK